MSAESIIIERDMVGATAMLTMKTIGDTLEQAYPGWLWHVEVKGGIAIVKSMHADPRRGFVIKLVSGFDYSASDLKRQVLRAGGEMLERLGFPRRRADWDAINHAQHDARHFLVYSN